MESKKRRKIVNVLADDYHTVTVYFTESIDSDAANRLSFFCEGRVAFYSVQMVRDGMLRINVERMDPKKLYHVALDGEKREVIPQGIISGPDYCYNGDDLGLTYHKDYSLFKVFAPTATRIKLTIYDELESREGITYPLHEEECGIWSAEVKGDLEGKFYSYRVDGNHSMFDFDKEVLDPYAVCVVGKSGRAKVVDLEKTSPISPAPYREHLNESIIYEIHTRDISIDPSAGAKQPGQYLALTEENSSSPGKKVKTITAHLEELGVNTIQLMPVQDFDNEEHDPAEYGWGYMPRFFNTPDGTYSSDWRDESKIDELKRAVSHLHEKGFKVILDVVYNHTAEGFLGDGVFSFNAFAPYYYYRFGNGHISNGSGCGNEFRSESPMGRKFIIDSLKFWVEFYGFDGFRFDLMGLLDLETMQQAVKELKELKSDIILYGEPWTAGLTPIEPLYKGAQRNQGFAVFNDDFRDAIKGSVMGKHDRGFVQLENGYRYEKMIQGILGSINTFAASPLETLNYVEVHDNHTLFDKLYFTLTGEDHFTTPEGDLLEEIIDLHRLSAFIILTSQGVPVLHLGQDFLRTKNGDENSYDSGDVVNSIDWHRKEEHYETFCYYRDLIEIRKSHPLFRINEEEQLRKSIEFIYQIFPEENKNCIAYKLEHGKSLGDSVETIFIIINPYPEKVEVTLDEEWQLLLAGTTYYKEETKTVSGSYTLRPRSGTILVQG